MHLYLELESTWRLRIYIDLANGTIIFGTKVRDLLDCYAILARWFVKSYFITSSFSQNLNSDHYFVQCFAIVADWFFIVEKKMHPGYQ